MFWEEQALANCRCYLGVEWAECLYGVFWLSGRCKWGPLRFSNENVNISDFQYSPLYVGLSGLFYSDGLIDWEMYKEPYLLKFCAFKHLKRHCLGRGEKVSGRGTKEMWLPWPCGMAAFSDLVCYASWLSIDVCERVRMDVWRCGNMSKCTQEQHAHWCIPHVDRWLSRSGETGSFTSGDEPALSGPPELVY